MRSIGRRAARKDTVHAPIVAELRKRGVLVEDMPTPGDVLCYYKWPAHDHIDVNRVVFIPSRELYMPMEFKSPQTIRRRKEQRTAQQKRTQMPIPIVETLEDALRLMGLQP